LTGVKVEWQQKYSDSGRPITETVQCITPTLPSDLLFIPLCINSSINHLYYYLYIITSPAAWQPRDRDQLKTLSPCYSDGIQLQQNLPGSEFSGIRTLARRLCSCSINLQLKRQQLKGRKFTRWKWWWW